MWVRKPHYFFPVHIMLKTSGNSCLGIQLITENSFLFRSSNHRYTKLNMTWTITASLFYMFQRAWDTEKNHIAETNIKLHERMTLNRLAWFELAPSGTPVRRSTSWGIESLGTVCSNSNPARVHSFSVDVTSLRKWWNVLFMLLWGWFWNRIEIL